MGDKGIEYKEDKLTELIIKSVIKVHNTLGPGFLESIYTKALLIELNNCNITAENEKEVIISYQDEQIGCPRLDILVENRIIIELKTVENFSKSHYAQIRSYLKATGLKVGILVNFAKEGADFRRIEIY
ncbi:MAG: GxxExxY protein [Spirochaetota bacterium]|nr:GxxExxY protein [Spirochaetota bacterium]